ncbi:methionine ABC transporter substrate-binding protein [Salipaludibacillus agaradhaerens]|uniref:MetQ/NlpA family ABC transporter substrate-binding protein n=1 Tax=Salipaludibacillus agaradhaerens TaxID=76935 RepID=UPI002151A0FE|nr:MetQ/NlpA family ABC transporter substrate-binding protein [Salipaludibacillus agaradhaerens]MCR6107875.1 methionine ABC transporter substrate-binding protein [Salipaludibacillus agaradhaerens]MCR6119902.1 methionine ABC transporter substrate-binding protein [Salipaludibacillus agaradhaerens]
MKKLLKTLTAVTLTVGVLAACGQEDNNTEETGNNNTNNEEANNAEVEEGPIVVGASNIPHAEILEFAEDLLEEEGVELEIVTFNDYILPNQALDEGELDANYFQHVPYLESQIEEHGYDFVNVGGIHIEPIGLYSQDYDSVEALPEGAEIIMSDSVADHGRILSMLENEGLITLAEGVGINATIDDIEENPNNFEFLANVEAALLPTAYENGEGDAILINSNYALDAGLNPLEDAILTETADEDNPYANVIAVNSGDEGDERILKLVEVLRSEEVSDFILETYDNAVVPVAE